MAWKSCLALAPLIFVAIAPAAMADTIHSVYTETKSCTLTEEGEDAFTRECHGPDGVKAVLQYTDGLVGLLYLPAGIGKSLQREDMIEISPSARLPYGSKLEWRLRAGDTKPCAAILRVYGSAGERLIVNELKAGARVGEAVSNGDAEAIADKVCARTPSATSAAVDWPPEVSKILPADVSSGVEKAKGRFSAIYQQTGISGVIDEIQSCYVHFSRSPALATLAECAALDVIAANVDNTMTKNYPGLRQPFFSGTKPDHRIAQAEKSLGIVGKDGDLFDQLFMASVTGTARPPAIQPNAPTEPVTAKTSVFGFSE